MIPSTNETWVPHPRGIQIFIRGCQGNGHQSFAAQNEAIHKKYGTMLEPTAPNEYEVMEWVDAHQNDPDNSATPAAAVLVQGQHVQPLMEEPDVPSALAVGVLDPTDSVERYYMSRDYSFSSPPPCPFDGEETTAIVVADRQEPCRDITAVRVVLAEETSNDEKSIVVASGVAGLVVGSLVIGAVPGVLAGCYSAYATKLDGCTGDIARALGEVALVAREKAIIIDRKHHVIERLKRALGLAWDNARELDRKHKLMEKLQELSILTLKFAWELVRKHRITEERNRTIENRRRTTSSRALESTRQSWGAPSSWWLCRRSSDEAVFQGRYRELERTPPIMAQSY